MNPVLTAIQSPPSPLELVEEHPPSTAELTDNRRPVNDAPVQAHRRSLAVEYGWRFWVCAQGADGLAQTTSVWGLWLDGAVAFAADTESVAAGDPREFPAAVIQAQRDGRITIVDGSAERVEDGPTLARFVRACEAKYGFELDVGDPDTPVFVLRPCADIGWEADDLAETLAQQGFEPVS
jgi:hypothetical protein